MTPKRISAFKTAFKRLDIDMSDILDDDKLRLGLSIVDDLECSITEEYNDIEKYNNSKKRRDSVKMTEEEVQYLLRSVDTTGTGVGLHIIGFIKFMCGTPMFLDNERVSRTVEQWHKRKGNMRQMSFSTRLISGLMKGSGKAISNMNYKYRSAAANIDNFQDVAAICIQSAWRKYHATHRVSQLRVSRKAPNTTNVTFGELHSSYNIDESNRDSNRYDNTNTNTNNIPTVAAGSVKLSALYANQAKRNPSLIGKHIEVPEFIFSNDNAKYVY